ncbi:MAG: glycoside hydrolase family 127 protein [Mangrovibacterium sp.]
MRKGLLILLATTAMSITGNAQSHYPGQHQGKLKLDDCGHVHLRSFDVNDVKLEDEKLKANMQLDADWLNSLSVDRLTHSFKNNAGIYAGREGGYMTVDKLGGWESLDCELRGHSLGHILSALGLMYQSTGNEQFKLKADSIVNVLGDVQTALNQGGYLSAYPQTLIDRNLKGTSVWAPWYTLHKLFSGLIDQYLYCDNDKALEITNKMAQWAYNKLKDVDADTRALMLRNEFGGVNDSFYTLYEITGTDYSKFLAEYFYHNDKLDPLVNQEDILNKNHANTYIPKLIGLTRAYELDGNEDYLKAADFFWNTVVNHHTFATGSNSDKEKFFEAGNQANHLTGYTGETCNVYNLLKLTRHLYSINLDSKYMDYYERAFYNHILGQQDPQSGMVAYFLPMLPGAHKVYSTHDDSFWCCVGTGFENHAKYTEAVYNYTDKDLYVNLFMATNLMWKEKGVEVIQTTNFPQSGNIKLETKTENPVYFNMNIRFPQWAKTATVSVNGKTKKYTRSKSNGFITIPKTWKDGDVLTVEFPMELNYALAGDSKDVFTITYGPIVLAAQLGTDDMEEPAPFSNPKLYNDYYTYDFHVPTNINNEVDINMNKLNDYVQRTSDDKLIFNFNAGGKQYILAPIKDIHCQRYNVYWKINE